MRGRIDCHSHLLPAIDDGCETANQAIACARELVGVGYTDAFCTPHIWPSNPHITIPAILRWTERLQSELKTAGVPLRLWPGGEMGIHARFLDTPDDQIVSYAMAGKYALIDLWADELPDYFTASVRRIQRLGLTVILAHPERMRAVQVDPGLVDAFADWGLILQGNLQCFGDPPEAPTRRLAEQFLAEGRYYMLGSDTHRPDTLPLRLSGLRRAIEAAGEKMIDQLTIEHPRMLLPGST